MAVVSRNASAGWAAVRLTRRRDARVSGVSIGRFVGLDLAWRESRAGRVANETGVAVLDSDGRVVDAGWTRGLEETVNRIVTAAGQSALLFVDAPLVVDNPLNDTAYKHREDLIDALLCAWTAALWSRHGTDRCQVLGPAADETNPPAATIIAPARAEQRR
jgi:predicted RNase H-like nuclease